MTVKELCLKLVSLREQGKIQDDTPVHFLCFDTKEYADYCGLEPVNAQGLGYELNGEMFLELVTELEIREGVVFLS